MNNDVVIIQLDRPRQIKFGHTALKTLVALTGKTIEELEGQIAPDNFELIEQLTYCGLLKDAKDNGETLTPEKVVDLMDEAPVYTVLLTQIFAAWSTAFGASQAEGNVEQSAEVPTAAGKSTTGRKASA